MQVCYFKQIYFGIFGYFHKQKGASAGNPPVKLRLQQSAPCFSTIFFRNSVHAGYAEPYTRIKVLFPIKAQSALKNTIRTSKHEQHLKHDLYFVHGIRPVHHVIFKLQRQNRAAVFEAGAVGLEMIHIPAFL